MKNLFLLALSSILFFACQNKENQAGSSGNTMDEKYQILLGEAQRKDSIIEEFFKAINEIEDNLERIKQSDKIENLRIGSEYGQDKKAQMVEDIMLINELMLINRQKIRQLEKQLVASSIKSSEFQKLIVRLELQLDEKQVELKRTKEKLLKVNNSGSGGG
jgi:chromosome segregation ATPase